MSLACPFSPTRAGRLLEHLGRVPSKQRAGLSNSEEAVSKSPGLLPNGKTFHCNTAVPRKDHAISDNDFGYSREGPSLAIQDGHQGHASNTCVPDPVPDWSRYNYNIRYRNPNPLTAVHPFHKRRYRTGLLDDPGGKRVRILCPRLFPPLTDAGQTSSSEDGPDCAIHPLGSLGPVPRIFRLVLALRL